MRASLSLAVSEDFRIHQRSETDAYLKSRGFKLFETLNGNLRALLDKKTTLPRDKLYITKQEGDKKIELGSTVAMEPTSSIKNLDENWVVHTKEVRENDFVEYEVFSVLDCPTDEQLSKLDSEA